MIKCVEYETNDSFIQSFDIYLPVIYYDDPIIFGSLPAKTKKIFVIYVRRNNSLAAGTYEQRHGIEFCV